MAGISGSGPLGSDSHMFWFGQPLQASPWPAFSDSGPGQCSGSGAFKGMAEARTFARATSADGAMCCVRVVIFGVERKEKIYG